MIGSNEQDPCADSLWEDYEILLGGVQSVQDHDLTRHVRKFEAPLLAHIRDYQTALSRIKELESRLQAAD